jgi:hypothetical protein
MEETELLSFLDKNNDIFAWQTSDLMGVRRSIIKHRIQVNPSTKPKNKSFARCPMKWLPQRSQRFRGYWM